mmetsp:Transcript_53111/g.95281  ORF Transcript_53111/g.95281 Transcript_53111/m.95281 type:complete len:751 (+) Transcript_53111:50-2302(+)
MSLSHGQLVLSKSTSQHVQASQPRQIQTLPKPQPPVRQRWSVALTLTPCVLLGQRRSARHCRVSRRSEIIATVPVVEEPPCPSPGRWSTVKDVPVLRPSPNSSPRAVVHFIGGAFFGAVPQWTYRSFLSELGRRGIWVIATPLLTSFDHLKLAKEATEAFEKTYAELVRGGSLDSTLPVYGVGHSMGALLSALIACRTEGVPATYSERLQGQTLLCYNSQSLAGAVPGWRELWAREEFRPTFRNLAELLDAGAESGVPEVLPELVHVASLLVRSAGLEGLANTLGDGSRLSEFQPLLLQVPPLLKDLAKGVDDFAPLGSDLYSCLEADYPSNLPVKLVKFAGDAFDSTPRLEGLLKGRQGGALLEVVELTGSHITANFNEPLDLRDGTDMLGRAALGAEGPMDAALWRVSSELLSLVKTVQSFFPVPADSEIAKAEAIVRIGGLQADDFRHPLDRRQTQVLDRLPGLSAAVRQVVSLADLAIYQDNISSSVLVGERQYPKLNTMLRRACAVLDIPKDRQPELYIRQNPIPNAYTLAVQTDRPFIVVRTGLLDLMDDAEVEAVIAHELGHLKCDHGTWLSAANILVLGTSLLPLPARVLRPLLERLQEDLGAWQRAAELSCDRAALLVAQEPWVPLSAMLKLSGGASSKNGGQALKLQQIEAFLEQADRYDEARAKESQLQAMLRSTLGGGRPRTHPMPVLRAREIRRWADSEEFLQLLQERGMPLPTELLCDKEKLPLPVTDYLSQVEVP